VRPRPAGARAAGDASRPDSRSLTCRPARPPRRPCRGTVPCTANTGHDALP